MSHVKNVRITNPKNVVVQIPGFLTNIKWGLAVGDAVEVHVTDDNQAIIIRPKKTLSGSIIDLKSKRVAGTTT